jgi:hypothetical protein
MKTLIVSLATLVLFIIIYSCSKEEHANKSVGQTNSQTTETNSFNRETGALLSADTTNSWVSNYSSLHKEKGNSTYYLKVNDLKNILAENGCAGIVFYHAFGPNWMVIPAGITADGTIIHADSIPTQNGYVSFDQAKAWVTAYQPNGDNVTAHFFGGEAIQRLLEIMKGDTIRFQLGWDMKRGLQLLLSDASYSSMVLDRSGHYNFYTEPVYK